MAISDYKYLSDWAHHPVKYEYFSPTKYEYVSPYYAGDVPNYSPPNFEFPLTRPVQMPPPYHGGWPTFVPTPPVRFEADWESESLRKENNLLKKTIGKFLEQTKGKFPGEDQLDA